MKRIHLATMALCLSAVAAYAGPTVASEADMMKAVNAIRAQSRTCPGGKSFPAAAALTVNPLITKAATSLAANLHPTYVNKNLGSAGYLAFGSAVVWNGALNESVAVAPDVNDYVAGTTTIQSAPKFWLTNQAACEAIMTPYTEAGFGSYAPAQQAGYAPTWPKIAVILAFPFDTTKVDSYKQRMLAEVNRLRATGVNASTYPGALCSSGAVSSLKWNDKMGQAAQFHSNDYATKGAVSGGDGSPHTGTAGDTPDSRIKAAGCTAGGGENVNFNFGSSPEDAVRSWITMSAGHCSNIFNAQATVAGFGIAASASLQNNNIGPFATFNLGADTGCSAYTGLPLVSYDPHVQDRGWMAEARDGGVAGTTGQNLRLEALKIRVGNPETGTGCRVYYQAHVQDTGWMPEVSDGAVAGTTGRNLRMEALKIRLVNCDKRYHVYYQAHVQDVGWMPEVADGAVTGTTGQSKRIEAIKIRLAAQ